MVTKPSEATGAQFKSLQTGVRWGVLNALSLIASKLLRGALIPKLLDPGAYGLFTSVSLFMRYLQFADLGSSSYFIKQIPHYHFNRGGHETTDFIGRIYSLVLLSFGLVIIYLVAAAAVVPRWYADNEAAASFYRAALLLLIPVTILAKLKEFLLNYAIATQAYRAAISLQMASNYISLIFVVAGVYYFGALGGVGGMLATEIVSYLSIYHIVRLRIPVRFSLNMFAEWRPVLKQFFVYVTDLLAGTLDQLVILRVFSIASLGVYALGLSFSWILESLSEIFNTASYPKLMAMAKVDKHAAMDLVHQTMFCFVLVSAIVIPVAIVLIEVVVSFYFPKYESGLSIYAIMLVLGLQRGGAAIVRRAYIAMDMEKSYIVTTAASVSLYSIAMLTAAYLGLSFPATVACIVLVNTLSFLLAYGLLSTRAGPGRDFVRNLFLIILTVALLAIYQYVLLESRDWKEHFGQSGLYLGVMFIVSCIYGYRSRRVIMNYVA